MTNRVTEMRKVRLILDGDIGYADVRKYGKGAYTVRYSSAIYVTENTTPEIDVLVHGTTIIGVGQRKYREQILEVVREFEERKEPKRPDEP